MKRRTMSGRVRSVDNRLVDATVAHTSHTDAHRYATTGGRRR